MMIASASGSGSARPVVIATVSRYRTSARLPVGGTVPGDGRVGASGPTVYAVGHGSSLSGVVGGALLAKLVADQQPDLIVFAQSYDGRDAPANGSWRRC